MKRVWACACFLPLVLAACGGGAPPSTTPGYTSTQYPIVLIPGLLGFQSLLGVVDYFPGIVDALEEDGATVLVAHVSQAADSVTRAAELVPQLEQFRLQTGAAKLNLIGHSQGALDARLLAATRPDLVASVTSVNGPNLGSPVAAWALTLPLDLGPSAIQALSDLFALASGSSDPNDAKAALQFLTPASVAHFDALYPAGMPATPCGAGNTVDGGVYYFSWGGQGWLTNPIDLLDPDWLLLGLNDGQANDGLVDRCSMHLGMVIRDDYVGNHIDAVNMIAGLIAPNGPDPKELFRAQANRLKGYGL